jgi:photosystem II stability/assembly factor-like uncharacterized protein
VGSYGIILKTTNEGTSWTALTSGTEEWLNSVFFTNVDTGYVAGETGTILKTTNGGATWVALTSGTTDLLSSIYFTGTNIGYAVGGNDNAGTILKTYDGGTTWKNLPSGTTNHLSSVYFTDVNTGYAAGKLGTILKTINGGTFIEENKISQSAISIYPNPTSGKFTITNNESLSKETEVSIFNIQGKKVMYKKFQNKELIRLDVSSQPKGIYLLKIQTDNGVVTKKLVIK